MSLPESQLFEADKNPRRLHRLDYKNGSDHQVASLTPADQANMILSWADLSHFKAHINSLMVLWITRQAYSPGNHFFRVNVESPTQCNCTCAAHAKSIHHRGPTNMFSCFTCFRISNRSFH